MVRILLSAFVVAACANKQAPSAPETPQETKSAKEIAADSKPAIVRIETRTPYGEGVGTGFFVDRKGVVATNLHVVHGAIEIVVKMYDGTKLPVVGIQGIDSERDLILLEVPQIKTQYPTLSLGDSQILASGDPVIAIGNPLGVLDYSVSDGLISSVRKVKKDLTILQVSAPISRGSSGGPLFNQKGQVIGVATAIFIEGQNLNFGVPSVYVQNLMQHGSPMGLRDFLSQYGHKKQVVKTKRAGAIERDVPLHDKKKFSSCKKADIQAAKDAIKQAIDLGAPLYNNGNHEACYRIYEGTAVKLETENTCGGVRDALGTGLLTAGSKTNFTEKAWAMRDAFDGVLFVIKRLEDGK